MLSSPATSRKINKRTHLNLMNHTWKDVLSVGVIRMNPSVPLLNNTLEHIAGLCVGLDSRWSAVTSESKSEREREGERGRGRGKGRDRVKRIEGEYTRVTKKDGKQDEKRHEIRYSWQVFFQWATFCLCSFLKIFLERVLIIVRSSSSLIID